MIAKSQYICLTWHDKHVRKDGTQRLGCIRVSLWTLMHGLRGRKRTTRWFLGTGETTENYCLRFIRQVQSMAVYKIVYFTNDDLLLEPSNSPQQRFSILYCNTLFRDSAFGCVARVLGQSQCRWFSKRRAGNSYPFSLDHQFLIGLGPPSATLANNANPR